MVKRSKRHGSKISMHVLIRTILLYCLDSISAMKSKFIDITGPFSKRYGNQCHTISPMQTTKAMTGNPGVYLLYVQLLIIASYWSVMAQTVAY